MIRGAAHLPPILEANPNGGNLQLREPRVPEPHPSTIGRQYGPGWPHEVPNRNLPGRCDYWGVTMEAVVVDVRLLLGRVHVLEAAEASPMEALHLAPDVRAPALEELEFPGPEVLLDAVPSGRHVVLARGPLLQASVSVLVAHAEHAPFRLHGLGENRGVGDPRNFPGLLHAGETLLDLRRVVRDWALGLVVLVVEEDHSVLVHRGEPDTGGIP